MAKTARKAKDKLTKESKNKLLETMRSGNKTVSSKIPKKKRVYSKQDKILLKTILGSFDGELKESFNAFLQERAKVIPISDAKSARGKYKQEGMEPLSFKEVTSFENPLFSTQIMQNEEYNPDTVDVSTYDLMRKDFQLAAGLAVIKLPIEALSWTIACDDEKIAKTVEWALSRVWQPLIKSTLLAVDYGFSCHEKVWERDKVKVSNIDKEGKEEVFHDGDLVYWKKIKPNHPDSISMMFDNKQNLVEIIQSRANEEIRIPIRKAFLFSNDSEYGNPFGNSRLKNAYKVWYWKELLYQFMMQYYERRGTPSTVATAPQGESLDSSGNKLNNLELGLRMASSLISTSSAVIPYQESKSGRENQWKLEFLKDDARGPMFVEAMKHLDARCLRAIYVPENVLTQEGQGGYSSASVHADLFLMSEKGLIKEIEYAINTQLIAPFVEANYPPNKRRKATIVLEPLDWNRKIALKEIFVEMLRNVDTGIQMGVAPKIVPSLEKMAAVLEIPTESWEDYASEDAIAIPGQENTEDDMGDDEKVAGRKKTRGQSNSQEQARKRRSPGDKRADRDRKSDTSKKK